MTDLLPDHIEDLRKSGLHDETIVQAALRSAAPRELQKLGAKYHSVKSALVFPYPRLNGSVNGDFRAKLFPAIADADGHTIKYYQPKGSDPRLYMPSLIDWSAIAADPSKPLAVSEGEKKALCLTQCGVPCLGLSGLWNWLMKLPDGQRLTLPELDVFLWQGRAVTIVPDSDVWSRNELLQAVFALGMTFVQWGAIVQVVKIPDAQGSKQGIDDYVAPSPWPLAAYEQLERVALTDPSFTPLHSWLQRRTQRQSESDAAKSEHALDVQEERLGPMMRFFFPSYRVELLIDQFRDTRGQLTAELTGSFVNGEVRHSILPPSSINLKSVPTRKQFAKQFAEKYPSIPWASIVETLCRRSIELHREGEPVQHIAANVEYEPLTDRLSPLVQDRCPSIIFADGGTGKSLLSILAALIVESGTKLVGLCGVRGRALYCDYESEHAAHVHRAHRLMAGHPELAQADVLYQRLSAPIADQVPQLQRLILQESIAFLVIDSLAFACGGGDLERSEPAVRLQQALRQLQVGSLIIAHTQKNAEEKSVYGSVFFKNFARSVWELKKVQEAGANELKLGLFHKKVNEDRLHLPLGFHVRFEKTATRIATFDVSDEPELAAGLSHSERLRRALKNGQKTIKELAEEIGLDHDIVRSRLNGGRGKWFVKLDENRWGLCQKPQ